MSEGLAGAVASAHMALPDAPPQPSVDNRASDLRRAAFLF
jgi:hypothetical protein